MDPISLAIELELATLLLSGVAWVAHRAHAKLKRQEMTQRERHHQDRMQITPPVQNAEEPE